VLLVRLLHHQRDFGIARVRGKEAVDVDRPHARAKAICCSSVIC
jgi:hypothetical protein